MSDKTSLISSVIGELEKSKREAAKAKLKGLLSQREQAKTVVEGIEQQIVELLTGVGESADDVIAALAG